jgi:hypothetical protein
LSQLASLPHLNGFPIHDTVNICFTHKGVNIVMLLQNERNGDAKIIFLQATSPPIAAGPRLKYPGMVGKISVRGKLEQHQS